MSAEKFYADLFEELGIDPEEDEPKGPFVELGTPVGASVKDLIDHTKTFREDMEWIQLEVEQRWS